MPLRKPRNKPVTTVITIETDLYKGVPGYAWWEVAVAEVAEIDTVREAYQNYIEKKRSRGIF